MSDESPPVERYYTYLEASQMLRVKPRTIMRYMWVEQGPRWRIKQSQRRVIPESTIRRWLARRYIPVLVGGRGNGKQTAL